MKKIKFRAWFELKNKMVKSENLKLNYDGSDDGFDFAFDDEDLDENANINGTMNFKLMQYTGLKDKNGVEIYEGDILSFNDNASLNTGGIVGDKIRNGLVEFIDCMYVLKSGEIEFDLYSIILNDEENMVIGNVYENKEILEVK